MQEKLVKYFWTLNLVTLLLVAFFTASGASELVASEIDAMLPEIEDEERVRLRRPSQQNRQFLAKRDGTPILRRNIFDSAVGPIDPLANDLDDMEPSANPDELPIVACKDTGDVKVQVLATVVSESNPAWSFASLSTKSESRLYRIGDEIERRTLTGITWKYVFLRGDRDECYIDLFGEQQRSKKRPRKDKLPSRREIKEGIQVVGPNERVVDRALLDQALANPAKFAKSVRVRPYKKNGKVTGFRLRRIKKNSPMSLLGAKKGDVFHSVNGVDLTSVDQALAAYQNLRNESELVFQITRKGRPVELKISVH